MKGTISILRVQALSRPGSCEQVTATLSMGYASRKSDSLVPDLMLCACRHCCCRTSSQTSFSWVSVSTGWTLQRASRQYQAARCRSQCCMEPHCCLPWRWRC